MTGHKEADLILSNYRTQIRSIIQDTIQDALRDAGEVQDKPAGYSSSHVNKDLSDVITSEIKASLVPAVEKLMITLDQSISARMSSLESRIVRAMELRKIEESELASRLLHLETKLKELRTIDVQASLPAPVPLSRNPYVDIEGCANTQDWSRAFAIAVSVANGTDFLTHLLRERYPSAEDFFMQSPIPDSLLALQVSINLARELLVSDKYCAYKLEMINELILNLVSPTPAGVSEKFNQLRDALTQLINIVPSVNPVSVRVREILKIVAATDRLITPQSSGLSTPPQSAAYF
jgi:hypothetical protein